MQTDPITAARFIQAYKAFLGTLLSDAGKRGKEVTVWLAEARSLFEADPGLLGRYRAVQADRGIEVDDPMLEAMGQMRIDRWVYLKDTRSYSVLLDADATQAYAVLGLTQRLRDVVWGGSGAAFRAALVPLNGQWVCDGLLVGPVHIGPNYRRSYTAQYQALRQQGRFSVHPESGTQGRHPWATGKVRPGGDGRP